LYYRTSENQINARKTVLPDKDKTGPAADSTTPNRTGTRARQAGPHPAAVLKPATHHPAKRQNSYRVGSCFIIVSGRRDIYFTLLDAPHPEKDAVER
jgi:hypothetical protein